MKLEDLTRNANWINTIDDMNKVLKQPRQGKIYLYHRGMIANDKYEKSDVQLRTISRMVQMNAEKHEVMPFQKRIKSDNYIYFIVR
jgi:hypothetical protein